MYPSKHTYVFEREIQPMRWSNRFVKVQQTITPFHIYIDMDIVLGFEDIQ